MKIQTKSGSTLFRPFIKWLALSIMLGMNNVSFAYTWTGWTYVERIWVYSWEGVYIKTEAAHIDPDN